MAVATIFTDCAEHRRLKGGDEESDGLAAPTHVDPQSVQGQLRSVRLMSAASVLLGVASVAMMTSATLSSTNIRQGSTSPSSGVGLSAAPEMKEQVPQGWYRTYLDCEVRAAEGLSSEGVDILRTGSLIYVAETKGQSARILKPVKGWISTETTDGITVLRPDMTYDGSPNKTDMVAVLRSRKVREANERLQESAMKLTAVEKKLMNALKKLKDVPSHVEQQMVDKWPHVAEQAPETGDKLAQHAVRVLHKTLKPEGAKNLLKHVAQNEHVQHVQRVVQNSKLDSLV